MAKTKVQVTESTVTTDDGERETKQYRITIPKTMAEFFDLEQGDVLEWGAGSASNKMEITVHHKDE